MAEKYGPHEQATLFVLLGKKEPETPNAELKREHGIALSPVGRGQLNDAGLLKSRKEGGRVYHSITPDGQKWCEEALVTIEAPPQSNPLARIVFELLRLLGGYAGQNKIRLADLLHSEDTVALIEADDLETKILRAYSELSNKPQEPISLVKLRRKLDDEYKNEIDQTLLAMRTTRRVILTPDSDRRGLTDEDHAAAIRIGREDKHFVVIGES